MKKLIFSSVESPFFTVSKFIEKSGLFLSKCCIVKTHFKLDLPKDNKTKMEL